VKYRKHDAKSGQSLEWVEIFPTGIKCRFEGRVIFDNIGVFRLALTMPCIEVLKNDHSAQTKELGILVDTLLLRKAAISANISPSLTCHRFMRGCSATKKT
jgi:hypothetical protein